MVPGGLVQTGGELPGNNLLVLAAGDALVAGLLGYRAASLRVHYFTRDVVWAAATYAAAIAIGAAAIRAMEIPRLVGPALLTDLIAILLQSFAARLGIVRGRDLAQASKADYPGVVNIPLYILAEVAIAATDLAEVLGLAIGLNLLFGLPCGLEFPLPCLIHYSC